MGGAEKERSKSLMGEGHRDGMRRKDKLFVAQRLYSPYLKISQNIINGIILISPVNIYLNPIALNTC